MGKEAMFLEEPFAITHGAVMAFDEDVPVGSAIGPRGHNACRGKRAWAREDDVRRRSEVWELR
jgi:hypothetical protein